MAWAKRIWQRRLPIIKPMRGYPAMFVVVPDLLDHLRAAFSPDARTSFDQRFEEVRTAALLVLDDLGRNRPRRGRARSCIRSSIIAMWRRLPTVITTSVSPDDLDPRIRTRILDETRCLVFPSSCRAIAAGMTPGQPSATKPAKASHYTALNSEET